MNSLSNYIYSFFGPEKQIFVTEEELQQARNNLKKTGIELD